MVGGTGKTPMCIALAKLLQAQGKKPFFLTRGYGGSLKNVYVDPARHTAAQVGDEPLELAAVAPTIVASDRKHGAKLAEQRGARIIIMDDGLQNPSLVKTKSLLVFDAVYGLGNGRLFPAGPMREPLAEAVARAQLAVLNGSSTDTAWLENSLKPYKIPVLKAQFKLDEEVVANLAGKKVMAFAGLGRPEKFFASLKNEKVNVVRTVKFPDHYDYSADEFSRMLAESLSAGLILCTTVKDAAKLPPDLRDKIMAVPGALVFEDPSLLAAFLKGIV
ncbi:tetraacyldisaccharide 4'-kinase [Alphaproteobacteria bacterium]|nr:tetraacyldisaccharide 4'-kinase [Alphaproteobacteria bacterium]